MKRTISAYCCYSASTCIVTITTRLQLRKIWRDQNDTCQTQLPGDGTRSVKSSVAVQIYLLNYNILIRIPWLKSCTITSAACLLLCEKSITGDCFISYQCSMITRRTRGATWSVVMGECRDLTGTQVNYNFAASTFLSSLSSTQPFLTPLYSQPIALVIIIHNAITLLPPPCHQSSNNGSVSEYLLSAYLVNNQTFL